MSRARREELDDLATRHDYLDRLNRGGYILPTPSTTSEPTAPTYGLPW